MQSLSRRSLLAGFGIAALASPFLSSFARAQAPLAELTLWGPGAGPAVTVLHAIARGMLASTATRVTYKIWRSTDELRAGLASGTMPVFILPTQTAATLYNRGMGVRLLNVMTTGLLYVVSADKGLDSIPALKGRSLSVPYRNDTPDSLIRILLAHYGLEAGRDIDLRFSGSPIESAQFLATGRVDAALLPEPAATTAILKLAEIGKSFFRSIDLQQSWGQATGLQPIVPQAGFGVSEAFLAQHPYALDPLQNAMKEASQSAKQHPELAAEDAAKALGAPVPVLAQSIPHAGLAAIRASEARPVLEDFFRAMLSVNPAMTGGGLPSGDFYL